MIKQLSFYLRFSLVDKFVFEHTTQHAPLLGVLLEQASQQGLRLWSQVLGEADLLHEDKLKQTLMVLIVKGQPATHHLVHDHA